MPSHTPPATAEPPEPPICFSRNDMSAADRKARRKSERMQAKARARRGATPRPRRDGPTPERMAKGDVVAGETGGFLVRGTMDQLRDSPMPAPLKAQAVLDRLHRRVSLDGDPGMNDRMYEAGRKYERVAHDAGLTGVAAQNLMSCGGGTGDPASAMPATERVHRQREQLRCAWAIMGRKTAAAVHAMLVEGVDAESVGRDVSSFASEKDRRVAAATALRIGLSMLVDARWA